MKPEDTANNLIAILGDTLQPYALTDQIIEEVKKGHPNMRDNVMMMVAKFGVEAMKHKGAVDKEMAGVKSHFEKESKEP